LKLLQQELKKRIPAAYILSKAVFGEYTFYVDQRAIIPRSFIAEILVEEVLNSIITTSPKKCLDLCTGSGCLAVMLASCYSNSLIDAVDVSHDALEVAKKNVALFHLENRITLIESDMFNSLTGQYDLIISNPPYVTTQNVADLPPEFKYEPKQALEAGENGLIFIDTILEKATKFLTSSGTLIVETGSKRSVLTQKYPNIEFTWLQTSEGTDDIFIISRTKLLKGFKK